MATTILRPNGSWLTTGWALGGGAASHHAAQADDTDATYSEMATGGSKAELRLAYTSFAVPAGAQIRSLTPRERIGSASPSTTRTGAKWALYDTTTGKVSSWNSTTFGVATTVDGSARTTDPDGKAWSQATMDRVGMVVARSLLYPDSILRVYASYIVVVTNERPVVTVTGPVDESADPGNQVTTTSTPTVTWAVTDPEGDAPERFRVKVFSAAQYGAAGFDPETAEATWDSEVQFSAATQYTWTRPLTNGVIYRAYVKVADVGSGGRFSLWAFREFTMALPAPPVPVVTASGPVAGDYAASISASSTGTTPAPEFLRFEFLDEDGVWLPMPGADRVATASGTVITALFREPPPNRAGSYRVLAGRTVNGLDILSAPSAVAAVTVPNDRWRLRRLDTFETVTLRPVAGDADLSEGAPHGVFSPLGADRRVVIRDTLKGETISLDLSFLSAAEWDAFHALADTDAALLLVSPLTRMWYVAFVEEVTSVLLNYRGTERRTASATWVAVDRP